MWAPEMKKRGLKRWALTLVGIRRIRLKTEFFLNMTSKKAFEANAQFLEV